LVQILQELHLQPPNTPNLDIAMSEMQFRPPDSVDALLNDIMRVTSCVNPLPSIDADILSSFKTAYQAFLSTLMSRAHIVDLALMHAGYWGHLCG